MRKLAGDGQEPNSLSLRELPDNPVASSTSPWPAAPALPAQLVPSSLSVPPIVLPPLPNRTPSSSDPACDLKPSFTPEGWEGGPALTPELVLGMDSGRCEAGDGSG